MTVEALKQLGLLTFESVVICGLLLFFFRLRHRFGLALLCVTLGSFQHLQTVLAGVLFIEVIPGLFVSPGSAILFTATLFATLLVYIREDALQARSLIVGIVAANLTLSLVSVLAIQHLASPLTILMQDSLAQFLVQNRKSFIVGTGMLCIDVVLIIVLYEFFFRVFKKSLLARIYAAMFVVVTLDTFVFVTASFYGQANYWQILMSGLVGKWSASAVYSVMLVLYLKTFRDAALGNAETRDVFQILTYRQRYDLLKDELTRDPMTGLFNRSFFNDNLQRELNRAMRLGHQLNLIMMDLDHFKQINDRHGHQAGDEVILLFADAMREVFRAADIPCRYGGEEFVVIMPDAPATAAKNAAERLSQYLAGACQRRERPLPGGSVSFTAGIANFPADAGTAEDLLRCADKRLYAGKNAGRDRVVFEDSLEPAEA
ncbi:MAG: diguanylate cyclase [Gammaproteobacteria bacterium]|nr:diguanylate cyclase [Gammaproteobacteria bacterium]